MPWNGYGSWSAMLLFKMIIVGTCVVWILFVTFKMLVVWTCPYARSASFIFWWVAKGIEHCTIIGEKLHCSHNIEDVDVATEDIWDTILKDPYNDVWRHRPPTIRSILLSVRYGFYQTRDFSLIIIYFHFIRVSRCHVWCYLDVNDGNSDLITRILFFCYIWT